MIILFTPHIGSSNLGDEIIYTYVKRFVDERHPEDQIIVLPTQLMFLSRRANVHLKNASKIYVGGSNLFSLRFPRIHQFASIISLVWASRKAQLLAVGQHSYEKVNWPLNKWLWKSVLSTEDVHELRDGQCLRSIESMGLKGINSGCLTLRYIKPINVDFTKERTKVIFTLTFYREFKGRDIALLNYLSQNFNSCYFWPQDYRDLAYLDSLGSSLEYEILPPSLAGFTNALNEGVIYVGTRLHGGIHALNCGVPSYIYAIDNRAIEMAKDGRIPAFSTLDELDSMVSSGKFEF